MHHNTPPYQSGQQPEAGPFVPQSPAEAVAAQVCAEYLTTMPGYQGTFSFGTPGGNDLDLRLCFENLEPIPQAEIKEVLQGRLTQAGIDTELDLLFMTSQEFSDGIRDLVENEQIEDKLKDGFNPHVRQVAVGDTSMFSLYIFATLRALHRNPQAGEFGSPDAALDRLVLTSDGAIGWMHFYTGCFLHEYITRQQSDTSSKAYGERLAKYFSRVIGGSTLAELQQPQLDTIKPELVTAIKIADADHSTDETMGTVLTASPDTAPLLDADAQHLLRTAGAIRSGDETLASQEFITVTEGRLFYEAARKHGNRNARAEDADPLVSYALGDLLRQLGEKRLVPGGTTIMQQGALEPHVMYIPLKTERGEDNNGVTITVSSPHKPPILYERTPGRTVGEGAIFDIPRSATVATVNDTELYVLSADTIKSLLTDPAIHAELQQPLVASERARRVDVLLRYLAREAGVFTRQTLPYTHLPERMTQGPHPSNPLKLYHMGQGFHDVLAAYAANPDNADKVAKLTANETEPQVVFEVGAPNDYLYVVSEGTVAIPLQNNHETITLQPGEFFGESSLLGQPTSGKAIMAPGAAVIRVRADWFSRVAQSRQPIKLAQLPKGREDTLPIHLLYHLAAEGYDRIRRRLTTQQHSP